MLYCHFEFFTAWENLEGSYSWILELKEKCYFGLEILNLERVCIRCERMVDEKVQELTDNAVDNSGVESTSKDSL